MVWQPPPVGWLKWNTDASRIDKKRSTTISYVSRDSNGTILSAISRKIGNPNILVAEVLAIREAIFGTIQRQMNRIIIESDCLVASSY